MKYRCGECAQVFKTKKEIAQHRKCPKCRSGRLVLLVSPPVSRSVERRLEGFEADVLEALGEHEPPTLPETAETKRSKHSRATTPSKLANPPSESSGLNTTIVVDIVDLRVGTDMLVKPNGAKLTCLGSKMKLEAPVIHRLIPYSLMAIGLAAFYFTATTVFDFTSGDASFTKTLVTGLIYLMLGLGYVVVRQCQETRHVDLSPDNVRSVEKVEGAFAGIKFHLPVGHVTLKQAEGADLERVVKTLFRGI